MNKNGHCKFSALVLALLLGTSVSACAPVAPWQRGNLAKPQMALDTNPLLNSMREHIYGAREAAAGGSAGGGGGCGCY
jgi:hypothetical protein